MRTLLFLILALLAAHPASAGLVYTVQLDTSNLVQGGVYYIDLQFIGDNGNTLTAMEPFYLGGSGDTEPLVMDTINQFFNESAWRFFAGQAAGFTVTMTNNPPPPGGFPDEFSVFLLDQNGAPLPTSDPGSSYLTLDLTGGQPNVQTFPGSGVGTPIITAVPEPDAGWFVLIALGLLAGYAAVVDARRIGQDFLRAW
jgi:hypothetical protein